LSAAAACPVPIRGTVTGFTPLLVDEMVRIAVAAPEDAGVNTTPTVQLVPAASVALQVVVPVAKLPAGCPVI